MFAAQGEVLPMFIGQTEDGTKIPVCTPFSNDAEKDAVADVVRALFAKHNVVRYVMLSEAWSLALKPDDDLPDESIKHIPGRKEVIHVMGEDVTWACEMAVCNIVREGKTATLTEWKFSRQSGRETLSGRFSGLLQRQTAH